MEKKPYFPTPTGNDVPASNACLPNHTSSSFSSSTPSSTSSSTSSSVGELAAPSLAPIPGSTSAGRKRFINSPSFCTLTAKRCADSSQHLTDADADAAPTNSSPVPPVSNSSHSTGDNLENVSFEFEIDNPGEEPLSDLSGYSSDPVVTSVSHEDSPRTTTTLVDSPKNSCQMGSLFKRSDSKPPQLTTLTSDSGSAGSDECHTSFGTPWFKTTESQTPEINNDETMPENTLCGAKSEQVATNDVSDDHAAPCCHSDYPDHDISTSGQSDIITTGPPELPVHLLQPRTATQIITLGNSRDPQIDLKPTSHFLQATVSHLSPSVASSEDLPLPWPPHPGNHPTSPSSPTPSLGRRLSKRKSDVAESLLPESAWAGYVGGDDDNQFDEDDEFYSVGSSFGRASDPCTPTTPKMRRLENYDPYQIFEVQHTPCQILSVRVVRGRNITLGFQDYYDTPDPYLCLVMKSSPEGRKLTTVKENNPNPVWDETFLFYLNYTLPKQNILEINLMESNYVWDQTVGTVHFNIANIREMDKPQMETFVFNEVSEVDIEFKLEFDRNPTLRYSLCLSSPEKEFIERRKENMLRGFRQLLGEADGTLHLDEVPTIAVIGSGGGFRAMAGYSGVFKALQEAGILDCSMYACGLSGSSWLLSTLYSHPKWPALDMAEFLDELKHSIDKSLLRFLNASTMYNYFKYMVQKRRGGQPVSFTDIFGRMVGETLLKGRMEATLSSQREKIKDGAVPMPLYTCVHVKKDVPARSFQEWVEFSPYEIGLPKYGTFMDSELFGSKFFMGKLVKQYKEQPLHFLQGIWGSAFCILFKRLLEDNRRIDPVEMVRQEMGKQLDEAGQESSSDCSEDEIDESEESAAGEESPENVEELGGHSPDSFSQTVESQDTVDSNMSRGENHLGDMSEADSTIKHETINGEDHNETGTMCDDTEEDSAYEGGEEDCEEDEGMEVDSLSARLKLKRGSVEMRRSQVNQRATGSSTAFDKNITQDEMDEVKGLQVPVIVTVGTEPSYMETNSERTQDAERRKKSVNWGACPTVGKKPEEMHHKRQAFATATSIRKSRSGSKSYWKQLLKGVFESNSWELLSTRRGRAAVIHNFMRGLSLQQSYPLSPFTPVEKRVKAGDEFDGNFEMLPTSIKHIYMVDAGLTFNSPFPLVLRPQREVDIILSFDFSARDSDNAPPFKELLLAEKWARLNRLPFPPVDVSVFDREGMKELYIFRHPTDPHCPIVLHFVLINKTFKYYKKPGVPRETREEFDFAAFDIFDDPKAPYSTFNFTYPHKQFERLTQLTEFNTLLHVEDIKEVIKEVIKKKREGPPRIPILSKDIKLLRMKSVHEMRRLHRYISRMESRGSIHASSSPSTPFFTPTPNSEVNANPFFPGVKQDPALAGLPHDALSESFSRNLRAKQHLHPTDPISESEELSYLESLEHDKGMKLCSHNEHVADQSMTDSTPSNSRDEPDGATDMQTLSYSSFNYPEHSFSSDAIIKEAFHPNSATPVRSVPVLHSVIHKSQLPSKIILPGPLSHNKAALYYSETNSSGYDSLGTDLSVDSLRQDFTQVNASGGSLQNQSSSGSNSSVCFEQLPKTKIKKNPPQNPFFRNIVYMNSANDSSSSESPQGGQHSPLSPDTKTLYKGRLKSLTPRLSPLVISPTSKMSPEHKGYHRSHQPKSETYSSAAAGPSVTQPTGQKSSEAQFTLPEPITTSMTTTPPSAEIYSLAPEAFKADGTPVFDPLQAKMYYESAKSKRQLLRRQSTVSSLSSISLHTDFSETNSFEDTESYNEPARLSPKINTIIDFNAQTFDLFQSCNDDVPCQGNQS